MMDLFRNSAVDILSFIIVDGVFKQFAKSVDDVAGKRKLWLKEFYVLLAISSLYLLADHVPYLLSVVTALLFVVTQNPLAMTQSTCATCDKPNSCTCKIPGNVSFRSPLPKNAASTPLRYNVPKETLGSNLTPQTKLIEIQSNKFTPFTSFKGNLMKSHTTSTPCPEKSEFSDNEIVSSKSAIFQYACVLKHKIYLLCVVFVDCFVHNFLIEFLALFLKPFKPVIQTKISPQTRTSLSAARSLHIAFSGCDHFTKLLIEYLKADSNYLARDGFIEVLRLISEENDLQLTDVSSDSEFLGSKAFYDLKMAFPHHFNFNCENSSIVLEKPIDRLAKSFIEKADIATRVCSSDTVSPPILKQMLNACSEEIENCAGVFAGSFHSALSKLSMAQWILNRSKNGTSVVSGSFEGQMAETMFCSTCDSFSYQFRKFRVLELEILVAPSNQARKITTLTDCLHYLTSQKPVKRVKNFECVCHDEFMQVNLGKVDKNSNNISAETVKQVSFADEASLNISSNLITDPKPDDIKKSKLFPGFKQFSKFQFCQLPEHFIVNLGRFAPDETGKIVKTINQLIIPENDLDLYPYTLNSQSDLELRSELVATDRDHFKYYLTCVIAHEGYTFNDGQYITYIRLSSSSSENKNMKHSSDRGGTKNGRQLWLKVFGDKIIKVNMKSELCAKLIRENAILVIYKRVSLE